MQVAPGSRQHGTGPAAKLSCSTANARRRRRQQQPAAAVSGRRQQVRCVLWLVLCLASQSRRTHAHAVLPASDRRQPLMHTRASTHAARPEQAATADDASAGGEQQQQQHSLYELVMRMHAAAEAAEQLAKLHPQRRRRPLPLSADPAQAWMLEVPGNAAAATAPSQHTRKAAAAAAVAAQTRGYQASLVVARPRSCPDRPVSPAAHVSSGTRGSRTTNGGAAVAGGALPAAPAAEAQQAPAARTAAGVSSLQQPDRPHSLSQLHATAGPWAAAPAAGAPPLPQQQMGLVRLLPSNSQDDEDAAAAAASAATACRQPACAQQAAVSTAALRRALLKLMASSSGIGSSVGSNCAWPDSDDES